MRHFAQTSGAREAVDTSQRRPRAYLASAKPLFFAHRGGSNIAPENTLVAFERGAALGADALELDIQTTRDDQIVVIHDPTVDRTTNGTGPVAGYTLAELQRLDAGYRFTPDGGRSFPMRGQSVTIPTLRDVLLRFPALRINLDLKESSSAREHSLWRLVQELEATDRMLVASGDEHASIVRFRRLCGGRMATAASATEIRTFVLAHRARATRWLRPAYDALQVPELYKGLRIVSPSMVRAAHRLGLPVHVWTVDERAAMERLLGWDVDGIMSDRPDILAEVLAAR